MGGRGKASGTINKQISIKQYMEKLEIQDINRQSKIIRETEGGIISPQLYQKCHCCEEYSIPFNSKFETCPICGWIDDEFQNHHPNSLKGMNMLCLNEARKIYFASKG